MGPKTKPGRPEAGGLGLLEEAFRPGVPELRKTAFLTAYEIQKHFARDGQQRFKFECIVGMGQYGVACRILEKEQRGFFFRRPERRFIVKVALGNDPEVVNALTHEIEMVQRLRGSSHVLQPIKITRNPLLGALKGPSLIAEYIENGPLADFLDLALAKKLPLPNRLLWRIFNCLLHFVIAMAWPGRNSVYRGAKKTQIYHNDMHLGNVLIGDFDSDEHALAPMLKLIDFGLSGESSASRPFMQGANPAVRQNIFDIGIIMVCLISGRWSPSKASMDMRLYGRSLRIESAAVALASPHHFPGLDEDLCGLVIWCCASHPENRPEIENLSNIITHQLHIKTAAAYVGTLAEARETDAAVAEFVRNIMVPGPRPTSSS
ncbi:kinase-like domain-containing protein [Durotheca rogersii]|uniref:kinase-like domain-containing protein n=1 Tax=Durotheca rogersii TaxID=419775 RepID=UPI002220EB84|nr:kinase-like domain-containing protein [Durotheca rogersii]KAI5868438.1 kinase-like domain-containing protein [Durotheca rogersii]